MKIATIVSEAVPFAKTGGLADVAGALPAALKKAGANVIVIMPGYKFIIDKYSEIMQQKEKDQQLGKEQENEKGQERVKTKGKVKKKEQEEKGTEKDCPLELIGHNLRVDLSKNKDLGNLDDKEKFSLYKINYNDVDFYFVRNDNFFARDELYGTPKGDFEDNNLRFGFFSKAVFVVLEYIGFKTDILHIHDYHFALSALFLKELQKTELIKNSENVYSINAEDSANRRNSSLVYNLFSNTKVVFTIHNIAYQGIYPRETLSLLGIDEKYFTMDGIEYYGNVNFMKAGIVFSDKITTVSPTYSQEILTPEYGYGLDGILKARQSDLSGIINGIDYAVWDPEIDKSIASNYNFENLSGKKDCKISLLTKYFNLNTKEAKSKLNAPICGMVSRLSEQKGIDLVVAVMDKIMDSSKIGSELFLIILGTGDEKYHNLLISLQEKYKNKFSLTIGYSDKMSREIYSGADIFIMPSKYEPCGLGQLISLKYGTIPIVRNTGGLADTIIDIKSKNDIKRGGQGFKFYDYSDDDFFKALKRAVKFYLDPSLWQKIIENGMKCNFSWDYSAMQYLKLYESIL